MGHSPNTGEAATISTPSGEQERNPEQRPHKRKHGQSHGRSKKQAPGSASPPLYSPAPPAEELGGQEDAQLQILATICGLAERVSKTEAQRQVPPVVDHLARTSSRDFASVSGAADRSP